MFPKRCLRSTRSLRMLDFRTKRSLRCPCFAYLGLAVIICTIASFLWMKGSQINNQMFFDGPELARTYNVEKNDSGSKFEQVNLPIPEPETAQPEVGVNSEFDQFNCTKLLNGDKNELAKAVSFRQAHGNTFVHRNDEDYRELTRNCETFKKSRGYWTKSPTIAETKFPLAFSILFHKNIDQLERLLRLIHRKHNQYCIHVDGKTPESVTSIVTQLVNCFDNVFIASRQEIVIYASYTRLLADIRCMGDHVHRGTQWNYLLNMAASELPILTNSEIVQVLEILNGTNDIHETFSTQSSRYKTKHITYIDRRAKTGYIVHSSKPNEDPPYGLTITKGNAYNVFSRAFVLFALNDNMAKGLLHWSTDTLTPDEHYWATLNNLHDNGFLKTPGGYAGDPSTKPFIGRYIGWNWEKTHDRCLAKRYVHNICVFSVEDLPEIHKRHELIANKFDTEYDPIAYKCMEEFVFKKTKDRTKIKNIKQYSKLRFLKRS